MRAVSSWPVLALVFAASCGERAPAPDLLAAVPRNAGKTWEVDAHTRRVAQAMQDAVRAPPPTNAAGTRALGERLQELLQQLIAGCTMQGPAHDALHAYLGALMPRVDTMHGSDPEAASRAQREVLEILRRFGDYFS